MAEGKRKPPVMKIFAGPPGTGKTYAAAREAVRIARPDTSLATFSDLKAFNELHKSLVAQGVVRWVTFHPSYSYEDFVEGFRPHATENGAVTYSPIAGPFLQACAAAKGTIDATMFTIGQRLGAKGTYEVTQVAADSVFLRSPKRGKNKGLFDLNIVPFALINFFDQKGVLPAELRHAGTRGKKKEEGSEVEEPETIAETEVDAAASVEIDQSIEAELPELGSDDPKHYEGRKAVERKTGLPITFFTNSRV
jgi:hypothetical protein